LETTSSRVLIVEDSEEVREIAVSVLADFGFSVVEAETGRQQRISVSDSREQFPIHSAEFSS